MNAPQNAPAEATTVTAKPRRTLSWKRRWLFRCVAICFGLGCIGLMEVALRVVGYGHDLQLIIPVPQAPGWYQLNPRFDEPFFGQTNLSGPDGKPFRIPKPKDTRRILVVGGSTVIGFPYTPDLAFPQLMQELLQRQAEVGERIEVLNAGITALNSSSEVAVVEEGLACDPDLIVVYTGHNEFYGPGGVASGAGSLDPVWFRRLADWKRLRLFQLARRLLVSQPQAPPDLMDKLSADRGIPRDSPLFQQAVERFQQNLWAMQSAVEAKNIPLLFVGPVCNERDQPPLEPALPHDPVPNEPAWHAEVRKAEHWLRYDQPDKALPLLQAAAESAPNSAIVAYRLGQTYDRLTQRELAASHYAAAVENDGTRFRAAAAFREVMEQIAREADGERISYFDARTALIAETESGIPDETHFLEHVHFTWAGNVAMANGIARFIQQDIRKKNWSDERAINTAELSDLLAVQAEEHLAAETLAMLIYEKPPFSAAADAKLLAKRWRERTLDGVRRLSAARREVFLNISTEEMALDPLMALKQRLQTKELTAEYGSVLTAFVRRRPWLCGPQREFIEWRVQQGTSDNPSPDDASDWPCLRP
ncbi:MAG: hypothetical protein Q8K78_15675 [Planctomycetaceae bacterium]|nr:hypothetical protein [Planctomycetaceae bacterium]